MKTEELIVQLAGSLEPVQPLASPAVRMVRWLALTLAVCVAGVLAIGARADLSSAITQPAFMALAVLAAGTAVAAAAATLMLAVPGSGRPHAQRAVPVLCSSAWALVLVAMIVAGGSAIARVAALPIHVACIAEIAGFAILPGWALFTMLRRAAPLDPTWSALLAALAATAMGAAATQIVCPIDDPAHHLVGHLVPMVVFTLCVVVVRRRSLMWWARLPARSDS